MGEWYVVSCRVVSCYDSAMMCMMTYTSREVRPYLPYRHACYPIGMPMLQWVLIIGLITSLLLLSVICRYCKDCVGLMTLVHDWNHAVEDGLRTNVDNLQAKGLRDLVRKLTDTVHQQETEIYDLRNKLALSKPKVGLVYWIDGLTVSCIVPVCVHIPTYILHTYLAS